MKRVRVALAGALVSATLAVAASAGATPNTSVHTSVADTRACAPLASGYLAGTTGGLAKVTAAGKVERVWTALDGLPETRVHALLDLGATTWVGTEKGFAEVQFAGDALRVVRTFASPPVRAFAQYSGALHVATWGGGLMRLDDGATASVTVAVEAHDRSATQARATSLAVFDGALFVGTAGGGLFKLASGALRAVPSSAAPSTVWALATDEDRLWIGGLEGSASLGKTGSARPEGTADVRALIAGDGGILAGTYGRSVMRAVTGAGGASGHLEPVAASSARFVQAIGVKGEARCLGTPSGMLIGTSSGARVSWQKVTYDAMPDNDVTAIARDGDKLYVGTYDRGVAVLEAGGWRDVAGADDRVNALAIEPRVAASTRVWVGTARGLTMIDGTTTRRFGGGGVLPSSSVHAVIAVSTGGVLVGTEGGAALLHNDVVTLIDEKQGVPLRAVWAVAEGPGGKLLLGTSAGLYFGQLGKGWERVSMASGHLKDDWVTALSVRGDSVYVGTYNGGVSRLDVSPAGGFVVGEHLGGGYVNPAGLLVDNGIVYASTMDGLVARSTEKNATWNTIALAAPGRDVTGIVPGGAGSYWVASRRGIARFTPASPRDPRGSRL